MARATPKTARADPGLKSGDAWEWLAQTLVFAIMVASIACALWVCDLLQVEGTALLIVMVVAQVIALFVMMIIAGLICALVGYARRVWVAPAEHPILIFLALVWGSVWLAWVGGSDPNVLSTLVALALLGTVGLAALGLLVLVLRDVDDLGPQDALWLGLALGLCSRIGTAGE